MSTSATLWNIEQAIVQIQEIIESPDLPESDKEIARQELDKWCRAELAKVDRIRGYLRHCETMEQAARLEAQRMTALAGVWKNRADRLKQFCLSALEAAAVRRVEGTTGVLRVQANGGKQALKITRADLIPPHLNKVTITFTGAQWLKMAAILNEKHIGLIEHPSQIRFEPDTECIRKVLEAGEHVPGAELEPRGTHLRVE